MKHFALSRSTISKLAHFELGRGRFRTDPLVLLLPPSHPADRKYACTHSASKKSGQVYHKNKIRSPKVLCPKEEAIYVQHHAHLRRPLASLPTAAPHAGRRKHIRHSRCDPHQNCASEDSPPHARTPFTCDKEKSRKSSTRKDTKSFELSR